MNGSLIENSVHYFQKLYPSAYIQHCKLELSQHDNFEFDFKYDIYIAVICAVDAGFKIRAIIINDFGYGQHIPILENLLSLTNNIDNELIVTPHNEKGTSISNNDIPFSPKILIYSNKFHVPYAQVIETYTRNNLMIEIVDESTMYKSLFISYGGSDVIIASKINNSPLQSRSAIF